ncbi:ATP-binding protein [Spirillospora sp. NPDC047279]|uniref:ATP-binding protein n=1 Tax=Spirillospora sp. NPDC047279 TaxID=3155478 RepID=UPI00340F1455
MRFSLALPRETLSIPVIRRVLGDALRGLGVNEDCIGDILVATSEACTNVIQHSRSNGNYEVVGRVDEDACDLKIMDWGRGLRNATSGADRGILSESGRGIKIMRALVDEISIESVPDAGTVVHLQKRLTWRDEALIRRLESRLIHSAG